MERIMTTNLANPWALIKRGAQVRGKRPSTQMAFLTDRKSFDADLVRGYILLPAGWSKSKRPIPSDDIVKVWRNQPSSKSIKRAKLALEKIK